jgi:hypothetical protein
MEALTGSQAVTDWRHSEKWQTKKIISVTWVKDYGVDVIMYGHHLEQMTDQHL